MLSAEPRSIFSWDFIVRRGDETVAAVDAAWFGERAEVTIAGERYTLARESLLEGTFAMRSGDQVVARARKPNSFTRTFEVELSGRHFELRAASAWRRELALYEGASRLGRIAPTGWLGRKAVIDLPDELPDYAQVFLFWLVLVLWRRSAHSSAAAAGT